MELVLISKSRGALGRLHVRTASLVVGLLIVVAGIGGSAYWGYLHGADSMANAMVTNPQFAESFWHSELIAQRKLIHEMRNDADADLNALAVRAGVLQAHVTRLDALAERLVSVANLEPAEFGLSSSPAIGGPAPAEILAPKWTMLLEHLDALEVDLALREDRLDALEALIFDRKLTAAMHPDGRPIDDGWISSGFGYRSDPVSGAKEFHSGVDFAGKPGLEVKAVGAGIITWSGRRWGYGNLVEINHGNGYVTRYAHNKKNLVDIGERVDKDETIALLGSSGRSTGPHVHFEVLQDGKVVNPWKFMKQAASR